MAITIATKVNQSNEQMISRRRFLLAAAAGGVLAGGLGGGCGEASGRASGGVLGAAVARGSIDRQALVARHNPRIERIDPFSALTVGNGTFAFTADVTGLQTFYDAYRKDFPLCTCAHWAWHTAPLPAGVNAEEFKYRMYSAHGREVGYATSRTGQEVLFDWLRENPHRLHLGRIGLVLKKPDGSAAVASDISAIDQRLDLWTGTLDSRFAFSGQSFRVRTAVHLDQDALGVRIESSPAGLASAAVKISFPYGSSDIDMADWNSPKKHQTTCRTHGNRADFSRQLDIDHFSASIVWQVGQFAETGPHEFVLSPQGGALEFVVLFSPDATSAAAEVSSCDQVFTQSASHWSRFWSEGGAIDLSHSSDARAGELERRIILSQFNTALHCAAPMPPPETGLLFNSWFGKSHLEMHWWHGVHFAAWNRWQLFERSLDYYRRIMPVARATAQRQGYAGARWPKMVGPEGRDSPSPVAPLLIWQQPHPIYYAELAYQRQPAGDGAAETLQRWRDIVFETADFMASYAAQQDGQYVLGPPLKTVPENTEATRSQNPTFELAYWRFGLSVAQQWRQRLGMSANVGWQKVLDGLAPLPQADGRYLLMQQMNDTYTKWNWEHPSMLGAYGMQRGDGLDPRTMIESLTKVLEVWQWDRCWGWDFPMAAMTAAKLGRGDLAVQALMIESPKNRYLPNGHVYQRPNLTAYLPANGGLLAATAMMTLRGSAGFPADGKWSVRWENLSPLL
jgi:hypothetical protein